MSFTALTHQRVRVGKPCIRLLICISRVRAAVNLVVAATAHDRVIPQIAGQYVGRSEPVRCSIS